MNLPKVLQIRAQVFRSIREYFHDTNALEVDTSLLREFSVTDPYMSAMVALSPAGKKLGYLQTSPEYAMKKLLCHGSGDIYQLGKVFRSEEEGLHHSSEFTMLEWYRVGFNHRQLMDEVFQIIQLICGDLPRQDMSYRDAFLKYADIDPFDMTVEELSLFAESKLGKLPDNMLYDNYLTLLFSQLVESQFTSNEVTFIYDFPASQASLARTAERDYGTIGCRFEAYLGGLELANGFWELIEPIEQLARFHNDNSIRNQLGYPKIEIDDTFISALQKGLPDCAGVALGIDRLIMAKLGENNIRRVLPKIFSVNQ
ncbi:EF-P lysine aminoacylase EpmA [Aliikangiella coralliicola]|nr:EF-P lysine aminoacylase EpmA [Aliikangiella coralliicola]